MKKTLIVTALLFPFATLALQVGTNQVEFVLSDSSCSNNVREVVLDEVSRIVEPSLPFCSCEDLGDGYGLFEGAVSPGTLEHPGMFFPGNWTNGTLVVPIADSFSGEIVSRIPFITGLTNEMSLAESFRLSLDQAFSETNGIAFLATNFVSKRFGVDPIPLAAATNIWASWRSWTSYPIPRVCFIRREVGPVQNTEFLWAFIPMNTGTSVFWLPIIFADNRWKLSMWDYELQGYSWE